MDLGSSINGQSLYANALFVTLLAKAFSGLTPESLKVTREYSVRTKSSIGERVSGLVVNADP